MHNEVQIPISPTGLPEQEKPAEPQKPEPRQTYNKTQYVLVNPKTGHIHAQGSLSTIAGVWDVEHNEMNDELKLEAREIYIKEIRIVSIEELEHEVKLLRQGRR